MREEYRKDSLDLLSKEIKEYYTCKRGARKKRNITD
jgi:hypothetical protein